MARVEGQRPSVIRVTGKIITGTSDMSVVAIPTSSFCNAYSEHHTPKMGPVSVPMTMATMALECGASARLM